MRLGIIAGNGRLPQVIAETVAKQRETGGVVVGALHRDEADPALEALLDDACWIRVGQLGKAFAFFRKHNVDSVVFAGGIRRPKLIGGFVPDLVGMRVIAQAGGFSDDLVLRSAARECERQGMKVLAAHTLVPELLIGEGYQCGETVRAEFAADIELGWRAATVLGQLDIGQTVVVHRGVVVALEGTEGTDACIRRGASLSGPGIVVVKRSKPQQDARMDLPTIGPETARTLAEIKAAVLVVESGGTLLVSPQEFEAITRRGGVAVVARTA